AFNNKISAIGASHLRRAHHASWWRSARRRASRYDGRVRLSFVRVTLAVTPALAIVGCSLTTDLDALHSSDSTRSDASALVEAGPAGRDGGLPTLAPSADASTTAYFAEVTADAPVAWFRFEETAGAAAADARGGPSGTYASQGIDYARPGVFAGSRAIHLDG